MQDSASESTSDDWKELVYVAGNWDGTVSVIYPSPDYPGTKDEWLRRHDLDLAEEYLELYPIQLPASCKDRDLWRIEDGKLVVIERDSKIKEIDDAGTVAIGG